MSSDIPTYIVCVNKKNAPTATILAEKLDAQLITAGHNPVPAIKEHPLIINYGRSIEPVWFDKIRQLRGVFINKPEAVALSVDKLKTSEALKHSLSVCSFSDADEYKEKILEEGGKVVIRKTLTGKGGKGIVIVEDKDELSKYKGHYASKYFAKTHEFRVHVLFGKAVSIVQKKRMGKTKLAELGLKKADPYVCNHDNGWVFAQKNLTANVSSVQQMYDTATTALYILGLDFGAVDIMAILTPSGGLNGYKVAEVNTAPGLELTNLQDTYVEEMEKQRSLMEIFWKENLLDVPGAELVV